MALSDLREIRGDTREVIELFQALAGGIKVLQAIGRIAKPIGWIAGTVAAIATAWSTIKDGWRP